MKLCLNCMRRIPLLAGRCPYCLDENQFVYGRILLVILLLVGLFVGGIYYLDGKETESSTRQELIQQLDDVGVK